MAMAAARIALLSFPLQLWQPWPAFKPSSSSSFDASSWSRNVSEVLLVLQRRRGRRRRNQRGAGMAVGGMLGEALKGVAREVVGCNGPVWKRVVVGVTLLHTIVREVFGTVKLVPYGAYARYLYMSLASFEKGTQQQQPRKWVRSLNESVAVARDLSYGDAERNLLDIYVPKRSTRVGEGSKPVIMFVHGGVWASGDKWQFSPLGVFLAEQGIIAVLVQYSLYPEVGRLVVINEPADLKSILLASMSALAYSFPAITKILAVEQANEVSQALTWTMDNIEEFCGDPNRVFLMGHSSGAHLSAMLLWERARRRLEKARQTLPYELETRVPHGFLGLAGVYNIGEHYKYEVQRGVGAISCMRPAMGGEHEFDSMSPSLLFESLLVQGGVSFVKDGYIDPAAKVQVKGVDLVPPCLLFASHKDIVVPPTSSYALNSMLQTLGCKSKVILHEGLKHEDYVLWHEGWGNLKSHLGPYLEDILNFVTMGTVES